MFGSKRLVGPSGAMAVVVWCISCENPQPPRVCGAIPEQVVYVGETATAIACFEDPDDDLLAYTATIADLGVATAVASGNAVKVTGISPGNALVTVTVIDRTGLEGQQNFRVVVPNRAPVAIGALPPLRLQVGDSAVVVMSDHFEDPDGEALQYESVLSDTSTATVSAIGPVLTIVAWAKGTVTVTVAATDPGGLTARQSFPVTVPNRAPVNVDSIPDQTVEVGATATHDLAVYFSDPDGESLTYRAVAADTALVGVSVSHGIASVTAIAKGKTTVTVTATDTEGLAATLEFAVTVPNRPPVAIGVVPTDTVPVGETTTLDLPGYFTDPDGDILVYTAAISNSVVATASVAGTAISVTALAKGDAIVTVSATDDEGLAATQEFAVTVPNRAPVVIGALPPLRLQVGDSAVVVMSDHFEDPDGEALQYESVLSDTSTATVSAIGPVLTIVARAKGTVTVTVAATDPGGLTARQSFPVTVPNRAPVNVDSIPDQTVEVGATATHDLAVYFSDPDGESLTYRAVAADTALVGVSVSHGIASVTAIAKGKTTVTVTATDTEGLAATLEFATTVPNRPPVAIGVVPTDTVPVGETTTLDLPGYFTDPDGDILVYTAAISNSVVATASVAGTAISVTALAKGDAIVTVSATDDEGLAATQEFAVTVPNRAPVVIGALPPLRLQVGDSAVVVMSDHFEDPDGEALQYESVLSDTSTATVSAIGPVLTIVARAKGTVTVTVAATDPGGLTARQSFPVTVPNRAPVNVDSIPDQTVEVGATATHDLAAYFSDPDGESLSYRAVAADTALVGVSVSHGIASVTAIAKGKTTVTVTATDTEGLAATLEFAVTVPNRPPVAIGVVPTDTVPVGETTTLDLPGYFTDPDGDILVYTAAISNSVVATASVAGTAISVTALAKGDAIVTVSATDDEGLAATQEFAVTVPNRAPVVKAPMPPWTPTAGDSVTMEMSGYFADPDGDSLFYAAAASDTALVGASVSHSTVSLTAIAKGRTIVTVTATDAEGLADTLEFAVTVGNRAPVPVGAMAARTLAVGDTATLVLSRYFDDADGDPLAFAAANSDSTVAGVLVSGAALAVAAIAKGEATVTVSATDTEGLAAAQAFTLTVPNRAPLKVGTFPSLRLNKGAIGRLDPSSYFADPDNDSLIFEAASSDLNVARTWVSRDDVLVRAVKKGTATLTVSVRDPEGLTATQEFAVRVRGSGGSNANHAPVVVNAIPPQRLREGRSKTLNAASHFSDPDGDHLEFTTTSSDTSLVTATESGAEVVLRAVAQGTATIRITARDPDGLTATLSFSVTVPEASEANRAPVEADTIPGQTLGEGDSWKLNADSYFSDPDGDDLSFTATSSDASVVTATANGAEVVVRAPAQGTATVTVTARDPDGLSAALEFDIDVGPPSPKLSICGRTPAIRDRILSLTGAGDCATVSTTRLSSITLLNLATAGIASLKSGDFAGLSGLSTLELNGNNLRTLPADVFSGLSSLETLMLSYNSIGSLPPTVFSGLTSISNINVSFNDLTTLPPNVFSGLSSLRVLFLDGNALTELPPEIFRDLTSLQLLFLFETNLATLPPGVFSGLTSLQWLSLEDIGLTTLPPGVFSGLSALAILDLANNKLSTLPDNAFSDATGLRELLLSGNNLEELPDGIFHGLGSLQTLWLHGNNADPMSIEVSLRSTSDGVKATVSTGAPFDIEVPLIIGGSTDGGTVTIPVGELESAAFTVDGESVTVDVGTLPDPPSTHSYTSYWLQTHPTHHGYDLKRSADLPLTVGQQDQQQPLPAMLLPLGMTAMSGLRALVRPDPPPPAPAAPAPPLAARRSSAAAHSPCTPGRASLPRWSRNRSTPCRGTGRRNGPAASAPRARSARSRSRRRSRAAGRA